MFSCFRPKSEPEPAPAPSPPPAPPRRSTYPIVLQQYKLREAPSGLDQRETFQWALHVITKLDTLEGHSFQCIRVTDADGTERFQSVYNPCDVLADNAFSAGGFQIGEIKPRDLVDLLALLRAHAPTPKGQRWEARDYVIELVEIVHAKGWGRKDWDKSGVLYAFGGLQNRLPRELGNSREYTPCIEFVEYKEVVERMHVPIESAKPPGLSEWEKKLVRDLRRSRWKHTLCG